METPSSGGSRSRKKSPPASCLRTTRREPSRTVTSSKPGFSPSYPSWPLHMTPATPPSSTPATTPPLCRAPPKGPFRPTDLLPSYVDSLASTNESTAIATKHSTSQDRPTSWPTMRRACNTCLTMPFSPTSNSAIRRKDPGSYSSCPPGRIRVSPRRCSRDRQPLHYRQDSTGQQRDLQHLGRLLPPVREDPYPRYYRRSRRQDLLPPRLRPSLPNRRTNRQPCPSWHSG